MWFYKRVKRTLDRFVIYIMQRKLIYIFIYTTVHLKKGSYIYIYYVYTRILHEQCRVKYLVVLCRCGVPTILIETQWWWWWWRTKCEHNKLRF
jgi:hypothetical protein